MISVGHCHSQLLIELLQLEGCISLPLLEGIDSRHAADLELSHLFLDVLVAEVRGHASCCHEWKAPLTRVVEGGCCNEGVQQEDFEAELVHGRQTGRVE